MSKKKPTPAPTPLTKENIPFIVDYEGSGFSDKQIKNITAIITNVFPVLSGLYGSCASGGGFDHMFFQMKDGRWLAFHNGEGHVTVSNKYKTFATVYKAFWDNEENVTHQMPEYCFSDKAEEESDFEGHEKISKDILENNIKKIEMEAGGKVKTGGEVKNKKAKFDVSKPIKTKKNVEDFFMFLLKDEGVSFHPDDDFIDYVNHETKEATYTPEEAELRNKRMDEAFKVCEDKKLDIYGIAIEQSYIFDPKLKEAMEGKDNWETLIDKFNDSLDPRKLSEYLDAEYKAPKGHKSWETVIDKYWESQDPRDLKEYLKSEFDFPVHKKAEGGHIGFKNLSKKVSKFYREKGVPAPEAKAIGDKVAGKVKAQMNSHYAAGGGLFPAGYTVRMDENIVLQNPELMMDLHSLNFGHPEFNVRQIINPAGDQWFDVINRHNQTEAYSQNPKNIVKFLKNPTAKMKAGGGVNKLPTPLQLVLKGKNLNRGGLNFKIYELNGTQYALMTPLGGGQQYVEVSKGQLKSGGSIEKFSNQYRVSPESGKWIIKERTGADGDTYEKLPSSIVEYYAQHKNEFDTQQEAVDALHAMFEEKLDAELEKEYEEGTLRKGGTIAPAGKYLLHLSSVGNPDFRQNPNESLSPKEKVVVSSPAEAREKALLYIEEHDLGGGNWSGGEIYDDKGNVIAHVSYNGRVWEGRDWNVNSKELTEFPTSISMAKPGKRPVLVKELKPYFNEASTAAFARDIKELRRIDDNSFSFIYPADHNCQVEVVYDKESKTVVLNQTYPGDSFPHDDDISLEGFKEYITPHTKSEYRSTILDETKKGKRIVYVGTDLTVRQQFRPAYYELFDKINALSDVAIRVPKGSREIVGIVSKIRNEANKLDEWAKQFLPNWD